MIDEIKYFYDQFKILKKLGNKNIGIELYLIQIVFMNTLFNFKQKINWRLFS